MYQGTDLFGPLWALFNLFCDLSDMFGFLAGLLERYVS